MIFALLALLAIAFPPLALWARRTGGTHRLIGIAGGSLAMVVALALAMASPALGNRLAGPEGYWGVAPRIVLLGLLSAGLPLIGTPRGSRINQAEILISRDTRPSG